MLLIIYISIDLIDILYGCLCEFLTLYFRILSDTSGHKENTGDCKNLWYPLLIMRTSNMCIYLKDFHYFSNRVLTHISAFILEHLDFY